MNTKEILARISSIEKELSALKELVKAEEKSVVIKKVYIMPSVVKRFTDDGRELLPPPPKVIYVDIDEEDEAVAKEDSHLGWNILNDLGDFYRGRAAVVEIQRRYKDHNNPKGLWFSKDTMVVRVYDKKYKLLGFKQINMLGAVYQRYRVELLKRNVEHMKHSSDPHINNLPDTVSLFLL